MTSGLRSLVRPFRLAVVALAIATAAAMAVLWPGDAQPQLSEGLLVESERAEVERIEEYRCQAVQTNRCRNVAVRLKSGPDEGERFVLRLGSGGLDPELEVGDQVRVTEGVVPAGEPGTTPGVGYTLTDFERRGPMLFLAIAFALLVVVFGRLRGALSLAGLAASLAIVLVFVVPALLDGTSPLAVALVGSLAIMLVTIALAHGIGPKSLAAMLGTALSLALTVLLAVTFGELTNLTGLSSEEAFILQAGAGVELEGLLLADKGQAPRLLEKGFWDRDTTTGIPASPSGGLLGVGNPISAAGMMKLAEIYWQLQGQAGPRQVKREVRRGLAQAWGDLMQVGTVVIMGK